MKNIAILGSTGSIGSSALDVVRQFPKEFRIAALSTNSNIDVLYKQAREFRPSFCSVSDVSSADKLKSRLNSGIKLFSGPDGLGAMVENKQIDYVLVAISGFAGLLPILKAIESKKQIALANKEAMVVAGPLIMKKAHEKRVKIIPVDSEASAIWQCLNTETVEKLKNIYLTASGGPFRKLDRKKLKGVSVSRVLKHPRWKMGRKITVDSATLMNKGFELLEMMFLFGVGPEKIKVLIHPEAVIHSMVEFVDGIILAQLSAADMRIPIQYALSYPQRLENNSAGINFYKLKELHFEEPDIKRFPCLGFAIQAARQLGTLPCVLNAANEVSVTGFLKQRIDFISIPNVIKKVLARHTNKPNPNLTDILAADKWARLEAAGIIERMN